MANEIKIKTVVALTDADLEAELTTLSQAGKEIFQCVNTMPGLS